MSERVWQWEDWPFALAADPPPVAHRGPLDRLDSAVLICLDNGVLPDAIRVRVNRTISEHEDDAA